MYYTIHYTISYYTILYYTYYAPGNPSGARARGLVGPGSVRPAKSPKNIYIYIYMYICYVYLYIYIYIYIYIIKQLNN